MRILPTSQLSVFVWLSFSASLDSADAFRIVCRIQGDTRTPVSFPSTGRTPPPPPPSHGNRPIRPRNHHPTRFAKPKGSNANANANGTAKVLTLIYSHHLLDHKPDNRVLKGGTFKLQGYACLGRPGVALCWGTPASIDAFRRTLQSAMPQKKISTILLEEGSSEWDLDADWNGFEEVSLGELRKVLASLGREDVFFTVTGMDPSSAKAVSVDNNHDTHDNRQSREPKGRKKRNKHKK